jgi:RNA polymerase sigma factor (sigma-70 family)
MSPPPAEGLASRLFAGPALRTQSDRRLVTLVREGYESAFEEIVRRYAKPLGRYAAGIVGGRSEDVTQDAFSKALLALRKDSEADIELRPWLYRIVRNTALNDLRDGPPTAVELVEPLRGGSPSAAEELERRQELEELLDRLRALPDPQRAAIVMRELEGLGHEEIARSLGMSGGAARQAIFRARQALRDGLGFLIPLPAMRVLLEHGHGAEAGAVAAGGTAIAAGAGGAGAGTALKVGVVTAVLAGSVGTGLAIKDRPAQRAPEPAAAATVSEDPELTPASGSGATGKDGSSAQSGRGPAGSGEGSSGGDSAGAIGPRTEFEGSRRGEDRGGHGGEGGRHGGRGGREDDGGRHGGPGPSVGHGGPGPGGQDGDNGHHGDPESDDGDHHGSADGDEGSGGEHGPSGSQGSGFPKPPPPSFEDDASSGPDSGDSDTSSPDDGDDSSGEGSSSSGSGSAQDFSTEQ